MSGVLVRTPAGLSNAHLFHKADYIIYCESHPDCPQGMSWDVGFWQKVFSSVSPDLSFAFKPQGSKSQIEIISKPLEDTSGHRSICCVDRDFDDIHCVEVKNPARVSTYGYAFENDLCDANILASAIDASLPGFTSLSDIRSDVNIARSLVEQEVRRAVILDQILSFYFLSLFDRDSGKFRALFDVPSAHGRAPLSKVRMTTRWKAQRLRIATGRPVGRRSVDNDTWRRMLGHLCWWLNYRISRGILVQRGHDGRLSEDAFAATCLLFFGIQMSDENWHIRQHYEAAVKTALAAAG